MNKARYIWGVLRILLGWIFLWPFLDKVWGLGFATEAGKGWVDGASPTTGFLSFATKGPFAEVFKGLAGSPAVDWLFMIGLLLIGLALMLGIGVKVASYAGALLLVFMYLAAIPPEHNPVIDDHIIYAVALLGLAAVNAGDHLGFGRRWGNTSLVQKYPILK